jgi:uncharacterized protein YcbX
MALAVCLSSRLMPWDREQGAVFAQKVMDGDYALHVAEADLTAAQTVIDSGVPVRFVSLDGVEPSPRALELARIVGKDPRQVEDHWTVLEAATGSFRTPKPCARCVVISIDPATGEKQPEVLAALAAMRTRDRKVLFGVNACWMGTDMERISVGDKFLALTG